MPGKGSKWPASIHTRLQGRFVHLYLLASRREVLRTLACLPSRLRSRSWRFWRRSPFRATRLPSSAPITHEPGGNPLLKIHPATYLAVMAAIASLFSGSSAQSRLGYIFGKAPALFFFLGFTVFCSAFSAINVGLTGAGVYVDNYLSAGAIAIAMSSANGRQRRSIAYLILVLCMINVLISLAEYVHQEHFIPLDINSGDGTTYSADEKSEEFRPAALYTHPLTGAMATAFGLFLAIETKLRFRTAAICVGTFAVGLLGFGGRAALVITVGLIAVRVVITLARDFLNGRINGRLLGTILIAVCLLGPLTTYLLTETPVGERIAARATMTRAPR